ncbi:SpoIID/LytB domain-containing protein [Brevibacillus nitrificans]|uniref:SpoIID/LytB domain-containing protein n=1 Tax=Brevibacillus nitrificans TaxID=651560 RepID=A0A3M8DAR5_9BACL|nr:SpoIID/LytB domain-containing protein [Brevibacillus nitrificans]RNB84357.1 SpoIID/LytB domain-containing protein [Brevibacillus nitrificans]
MDDMWKKWMGKVLSAGLVSAVLLGGYTPADAAGKNIRVALFVDTGQGYRGVVPAVTLTTEKGMEVTLSGPQGKEKLPSLGGEDARFRVDEYHLIVAESSDWNQAQRVAQQMSQRKYEGSIQVAKRGGQTVYQVVSGTYGSYQIAANAAKTIAQATGQQPAVKGPLRLEAGRYGSLKEAQSWQEVFASSGIAAYPVLVADNGKIAYAVWVGDEVSQDALNALAKRASAEVPGFSYKQASAQSYVVLKQDAYGAKNDTIWKYVFSPQVKLTVEPKKAGSTTVIGVFEREQRTYRGEMELSEYKGNLTLVNEVSMEEYLYGVVGSEMAPGWPIEALKAQAVLARTRAAGAGNKYGVANVSDTVYEQAYYGYTKESKDIREAVDETEGEVIYYKGKIAESLFYSNAGGMTADGTEVWGNPVPYLRPVMSDDTEPLEKANIWYQVSLNDGTLGYIRSDLVKMTGGKNAMGLRQAVVSTSSTNLRSGPSTAYHRVLSTLPTGAEVTIVTDAPEENAYSWTRGPYTPAEVAGMINANQTKSNAPRVSASLESLRVTERGPSGRVVEMEADGTRIAASSPDAHRSIFTQGASSLRSTLFDVEEMGTYTILGAGGKRTTYPAGGRSLQAVGADGYADSANGYNDEFLIYRGTDDWCVASKTQKFLFKGTGYGHGLGVSQYGAKGMAQSGYDYKEILQHYYQDVTIEE